MWSMSLISVLDLEEVAALAGPRSYSRGRGYQADGRVEMGAVTGSHAEAVVRGTMPYQVALWVEAGELEWSCSCPIGEDGDLLDGPETSTRPSTPWAS